MYQRAKIKECAVCGKPIPQERASNNIKYCSEACTREAESQKKKKAIATRAKKINAIAHLAYRAYNCKCALCGWQATAETITYKGRIQYAHGNELHHIVPVAEGGTETADNIILLCPNHHKQADLGIIDRFTLQEHAKSFDFTTEEKERAIAECADIIASAIF